MWNDFLNCLRISHKNKNRFINLLKLLIMKKFLSLSLVLALALGATTLVAQEKSPAKGDKKEVKADKKDAKHEEKGAKHEEKGAKHDKKDAKHDEKKHDEKKAH